MRKSGEPAEPIPGIEQYASSQARWAYQQEYERVSRVLSGALMPEDIRSRATEIAVTHARLLAEPLQFRVEPVKAMANGILAAARQLIVERGWDPEPHDHNFAWHLFSDSYIHARSLQMAAEQGKLSDTEGLMVLSSGNVPELKVGAASRVETHTRQNTFFLDMLQRVGFPKTELDQAYEKALRSIGGGAFRDGQGYAAHPQHPFGAHLNVLWLGSQEQPLIERVSIQYALREPLVATSA